MRRSTPSPTPVRPGLHTPPRHWLAWVLVVILTTSVFVSPDAQPTLGAPSEPSVLPLTPPPLTAHAAYVVDVTSGAELFAFNPDERLPPASTTKIASVLVILQHASLSDQVVIDASDPVDLTQSQMGLVAGDTVTIEQLLYGMLLPSGNDAAHAAARAVGAKLADVEPADAEPAVAAFVDAMNGLAASLGLENTHFTNAAGLDAPDHYSSARDLAILTNELLKNETLAEIVQTRSWHGVSVGPEERFFPLENTNQMLGQEGVHGVKTGTTRAAGACLITARWFAGDNRVIAVVLGSDHAYDESGGVAMDTRFEDMNAINAAITAEFHWISPLTTEEVPGLAEELAVWNLMLKQTYHVPVPVAEQAKFQYRLVLGPAGPPESEVGRVLFFVGSDQIGDLPVYQAPPGGATGISGETATAEASP